MSDCDTWYACVKTHGEIGFAIPKLARGLILRKEC